MNRLLAWEPGGFDELEPFLDAAWFAAVAVVIGDAFAPGEPESGVTATGENGSVFEGNVGLITVAIESPCLELAAGEFSFVHEQMEGMRVVVALLANGIETRDELGLA